MNLAIEASACSATVLRWDMETQLRPQRTGVARPSEVGITASSVVTKIVDKINNSYTSTRVSSLLGRLKQLYRLGELTRGVATTFTRTCELRHLPSMLTVDSCTPTCNKKEQKLV